MKLHGKLERAIANRDIDAHLNLLHEDFTVTFHKSGDSLSKEKQASMVISTLANEKFIHESSRCVYENNDMLIQHNFMSYLDDTREAVMLVAMLKHGRIINLGSGTTSLN